MLVTKQLTAAIDFYSKEINTVEVQQLFAYPHSSKYLKNIFACSHWLL